jgi:glycosyltransferase involved in cell wall biosynthesis
MNKKYKVLVLSDHALSTSGVGTQTRHLINGLLQKKCWTFRQFGAAMKHSDYRTVVINDDFIIKPIDGFGNRDLIRVTLAAEKPDLLLIFTDPRFFTWLFEMEDEVHQMCPIAWWHVWDNAPFPSFNDAFYRSTDLINCHSHMTYELIKDKYPGKVNFIPHAIPDDLFFPLDENVRLNYKRSMLGSDKQDHFVGIWVNRNAKRKRSNDVLLSFKTFLDDLEKKHGHKKATLIMHTDPLDQEGPNLFATADMLGITSNVVFSKDRIEFEKMNILLNISDFCLNISFAEGFGLGTLEAMSAGVPIIAAKTGGLTRQVVDHRDQSENGVALEIDCKTLVGSQSVPYIFEDMVNCDNVAKGMMKLYDLSPEEKKKLRTKVRNYARSEFNYQKTIDDWHDTALNLIETWKQKHKSWEIRSF